ncbi:energy transducer TonB [Candidatus Symbiobacter mobilis]|uniref:TolA-like protein n=1 Tax=Candidatus Symbiobacter mobilis CR TaxID=946483 RepID=U5N840_9BURK|nr:energy transducer TonB [Candidatus Symbiobacter mobilis]AGX87475.1 TolA-like protein [Candidatus Symbiobacter mobilis CR]
MPPISAAATGVVVHPESDRPEFLPPHTPGSLRAFGLALLVHGLLLFALTWGVQWQKDRPDTPIEAEIWAALPQESAPPAPVEPPAPPPAELAPPDPPPQEEPEIATTPPAPPRPIERPLERPKPLVPPPPTPPKPIPPKTPAPPPKKPPPPTPRAAQPVLDDALVAAQRTAHMQRLAQLAGVDATSQGTGTAAHSAAPSAGYAGRIRARIRPNIVFTEDVAGNPTAEVEVRAAPDGRILGRRLVQPSGVASWDDAVLKAIDKTDSLPRDTDGRVPTPLVIVFSLRD